MKQLEPHEVRCLQAINNGTNSEFGPCSPTVLSELQAKGLIISSPEVILPLPLMTCVYSITEAGTEALRQSES